ncbi:hypothetical protein N9N38_04585, partial [Candidatus Pelagibacter bacterium]
SLTHVLSLVLKLFPYIKTFLFFLNLELKIGIKCVSGLCISPIFKEIKEEQTLKNLKIIKLVLVPLFILLMINFSQSNLVFP